MGFVLNFRHVREVHDNDKPKNSAKFQCSICDNKFDRKGKLQQHLRKVHQVVSEDEGENEVKFIVDMFPGGFRNAE